MANDPQTQDHALDGRRFVSVAEAEDPLSSEALVQALEDAQIPVWVRPRRMETLIETLTGAAPPWTELLVPEDAVERAQAIVAQEQTRQADVADANARAVDEETAAPE